MTYNKEELLQMLSNAPLSNGVEFHEGKNNEFFTSIDRKIYNHYFYAHGATKLVLIPLDEDNQYVIKIPYTGSFSYYSGYYSSYYNNYHHGREDYWEFFAAEDDERPWDYCAGERNRYIIAKEAGFAQCLAKTELLGYINDYPVYIQEKCTVFNNCKHNHKHSKYEKLITSSYCKYYDINTDWLTDFRLYYGINMLVNFINFIQEKNWDDDLRDENIGYINNRPVLIDYSGFLE